MKLSVPKIKKVLMFFQKSFSYILGNTTFLYFCKRDFLIFWKTELSYIPGSSSSNNKKFYEVTFQAH